MSSTKLDAVIALLVICSAPAWAATVQIDLRSSFNADTIVNLGTALDTMQVPIDWPVAVAAAPYSWSYPTQSAATSLSGAIASGLPDDGFFAAGTFNPEVQLVYCDGDDGFNTTRLLLVGDNITFAVPQDSYSELHIFATTGSGDSFLNITLTYTDTTTSVFSTLLVPDWFNDPVDTSSLYHLIDGLDRLRPDGTSGYDDANDPAIFGIRVAPDPSRTLDTVRVVRAAGGGFDAIPCIFGATAVKPSGLSSSFARNGFAASALVVTPAGPLTPGATYDVDVTIDSNSASAQMVTVALEFGPGVAAPSLPTAGTLSTMIMVPAMGSAVASFIGIAAPAGAEVHRLHAIANADLALPECSLVDNLQSTTLCFVDSGCAASCGDCDLSGVIPSTILDALRGAQISAGLLAPSMAQLCNCDVNDTGAIEILDSLLMAQSAAGLPTAINCPGSGAAQIALAIAAVNGVDPIEFEFDVCGPMNVDLVFEFTTDAGSTFLSATATAGSPLSSPALATATGTLIFIWNSLLDIPLGARPQTVALRITATDPLTAAVASSLATPFLLSAGTCAGTIEGDLSGMPLPIVVPGSTIGADDTVAMSCAMIGGSDNVYRYVPSATAGYTFSLCGSTYDTSIEIRETDCSTGVSLGCNDDSCAFQSSLSVPLTAGTTYWVLIDGYSGDIGTYTLNITSP